MELTFIRADHEVTGSCHYLHVAGHHILVDYGMEQGRDRYENIPLPVPASDIEIVLLTHAHVDHTGMLPELYAKGFRGRIISTRATKDLSDTMLRDCAHIQMQEAEYANQKAARRGTKETVQPLYTMEDTMNVLTLFEAYPYGVKIDLCEGLTVRFTDIGHLLGSASIECWLTEDGQTRLVVFSGDIGNTNQPLLRDPQPTAHADYVVMESTYGNRYHTRPGENNDSITPNDPACGSGFSESGASGAAAADALSPAGAAAANASPPIGAAAVNASSVPSVQDLSHYIHQLAEVIEDTMRKGGNVVIPAFAVGRTQSLLYFIRQIRVNNLIPDYPDFPVYVDSPMAVAATTVFENNEIECYDEEARALLRQGINPITFPGLHLSISTDESKAINTDPVPKVIISASGMCDAGRIRHHIKYNVSNPDSTILFVGFQSEGTLGRKLLDGAEKVKLFGNDYEVRAKVAQMDGMSGHADKAGLLAWICAFEEKPRQVFIVHGDDEAADAFAACLSEEYGYQAMAPYSGTKYDLLAGRFIRIAKPVPVKTAKEQESTASKAGPTAAQGGTGRTGKPSAAAADSYTKLKIAEKRLSAVIESASGLPNKELTAFAREINDLCNKYRIDS